ncbi:hypothetical protein ACQSSU_28295 [Micromonospora echinospora]
MWPRGGGGAARGGAAPPPPPATAVIEYVGKRGARIVLVGSDGEWGDQFADGTDVARQACALAGVAVENAWERELMDQMRPSNDLWRSMARRTMAR